MQNLPRPTRTNVRKPAPKTLPAWKGVRMRHVRIGADADSPLHDVSIPVDWDDDAAAALLDLTANETGVSLAAAASAWIAPLANDQRASPGLGERLCDMLLRRVAAPGHGIWGTTGHGEPHFVVNLAAFSQGRLQFDLEAFQATIETIAEASRLAASPGRTGQLLLSNLDCCLAYLGLDYDSPAARDVAACLTALATATCHSDTIPLHAAHAVLPKRVPVPGLAERAHSAWQDASSSSRRRTPELFPGRAALETGFSLPGPIDTLLGCEACGPAPIFSPVRQDGRLASHALARLAASGLSPHAALAAVLSGQSVLQAPNHTAMQAMHRAVSCFIDQVPVLVEPQPSPRPQHGGTVLRELPARHGGFTQKASIGGYRLYLRTGEYADGALGEITLNGARDAPAQRGLMEAFSQAVSLGLQHGVPLGAYIDAFAYTKFGPHGVVEGDETISSATSVVDYAFRTLAKAYLDCSLPDAASSGEDHAPMQAGATKQEALLPLDMPQAQGPLVPRGKPKGGTRERHGLRLVG